MKQWRYQMNDYQSKTFDRNMHKYIKEYEKMKASVENLIGLISQNKELHGPHKKIMLDILKDICNNVVVGNKYLNKSFGSVKAFVEDVVRKTEEL